MRVQWSKTGYKELAYDGNRNPRCILEAQTATLVDESRKILSTPCHTHKTKIGLAGPFTPVVYFGYTLDIIEACVDSKLGFDLS